MIKLPGLAGKKIAVTGAAAGIGYEIARTLSDAECQVYICDVDAEACEAAQTHIPGIKAAVADVAVEDDVKSFFASIEREFGGLDALVNNAGIAGPTAPIEDVTTGDWQRCVDVGLTGQFLCAREAVGYLRKAGGGSIISMSSVVGKLGLALRSPYSAVKFGVIGITQCLAKELGPDNIRVNAILPGIVRGPRIQRVIEARAQSLETTAEDIERKFVSSVSMRRMVEASDIAGMTAFLISDLGKNITGQSIAVDANVETI